MNIFPTRGWTARSIPPILVGLLFASCAGPEPMWMPSQREIAFADYGAVPDNPEKIVKDYLFETLLNPTTADWEYVGVPFRAYDVTEKRYGYGIYFWLNATRRLGGPDNPGWKKEVIFVHDGKVLAMRDGNENERGVTSGPIVTIVPVR